MQPGSSAEERPGIRWRVVAGAAAASVPIPLLYLTPIEERTWMPAFLAVLFLGLAVYLAVSPGRRPLREATLSGLAIGIVFGLVFGHYGATLNGKPFDVANFWTNLVLAAVLGTFLGLLAGIPGRIALALRKPAKAA